jgi:hypothetical protein
MTISPGVRSVETGPSKQFVRLPLGAGALAQLELSTDGLRPDLLGDRDMPTTAQFTANPTGFAASYSILVAEPPGLLGALATGQNHVIAPLLANFDFAGTGVMVNTAVCTIGVAATASSVPCYFLPYLPDGATTMTIGNAANYFFTSMLTGCTVRVCGPAATPTITHSNAGNTFKTTGGGLAAATTAAQVQINNMIPAVIPGQLSTSVTRLTMEAAYTPGNMAVAQGNYPVAANYRIKEFDAGMVTSHGTPRPELGMFVYGVKTGGNWEFYSSTSTSVVGREKTGKTYFGFINSGVTNRAIADGVVLGGSPRFWP